MCTGIIPPAPENAALQSLGSIISLCIFLHFTLNRHTPMCINHAVLTKLIKIVKLAK